MNLLLEILRHQMERERHHLDEPQKYNHKLARPVPVGEVSTAICGNVGPALPDRLATKPKCPTCILKNGGAW